MVRKVFSDQRFGAAYLQSTETVGLPFEIDRGGIYLAGVVGLPAKAMLTVELQLGAAWIAAGGLDESDLRVDGEVFSGVHGLRLACGHWRFRASVAGATVYLAPAEGVG